jgi:hypothetical protein
MAIDIDEEIYLDNDDLIVVTPLVKTVNGTTGAIQDTPLVGRMDGVVFISTSSDTLTATAFGGLSKNLSESPSGVYSAVMEGNDKSTAMAASVDATTFYYHIEFGADYHVVVPVTLRRVRPAL